MLLPVNAMEDHRYDRLMGGRRSNKEKIHDGRFKIQDCRCSPKQEPESDSSANILVKTLWKDEEEQLPVSFCPLKSSPSEEKEFVKKEIRERTRERSSSESDEFNEPDPDSSDEWLPSESASSRDSSPDSHGRRSSSTASRADSGLPNVFPFTATPGPRSAAAELDSGLPADFLELFLTDDLLQHIAQQTNLYARQYFQSHPDSLPHSRGHAWKPVSVPELKTFFGLTFLTGYIRKPSLEMYWSVDEIDATPYFSQTMSRNRFQIIWRFLHYNDNTSLDVTDKMCKVRPVLDYLVEKFKEMYQPGQNICIDEGMMQWRGCLSFKVYNPQKPFKYGIKSYLLCDSATGY